MSESPPLRDDFDESDSILRDLNVLLNETSDEISPGIIKCISKAFSCYSAHVRGKALDLLAKRASPKLWLPNASQAGDLVLWHADDPDARVRDRALHCILMWMRLVCGGGVGRRRRATHSAGSHPGTGGASGRTAQLESERQDWLTTSVEAVYATVCSGLLDVDHVVRRTSLRVLCQLSLAYPRHQLSTANPGLHSFCPGRTGEEDVDSDEHHPQLLVDNAFVRICLRLQDSNRQVRQLAAQLLSSLAKSVGSDRLLQTLEKTVMSDRQVRSSLLSSAAATTTGGPLPGNGSNNSSSGSSLQHRHEQNQGKVADAGERQVGRRPFREFSVTATGSSGAIITGLEDDFFEVRCATLATITHVASLDTKFAQKCQDLLVDMLTDDIQDVRLAAVCALGAVGDRVSLQAEQVTIITSALAEGSGQMRRRLHRLLSTCRMASAPCLISLLDGLLHNLRRYPRDRDSIWRCAASVGRRHPTFVETCLSSLLHTHSWLSGPEPKREDPAYLTVLLVVLNAEPGAPGMSAKFPRHLTATKVYLHELVPGLLPEPVSTDVYLSPDASGEYLGCQPAAKKPKFMTTSTAMPLMPPFTVHTDGLTKFLTRFVERTIDVLTEARQQLLSCRIDTRRRVTGLSEDASNKSRLVPSHLQPGRHRIGHQPLHLAVLVRLIFVDLHTCAQQLHRDGRLSGLFHWLRVLSTLGLGLVSLGESWRGKSTGPRMPLRKLLFMALKAEHLYFGKTAEEHIVSQRLTTSVQSLVSSQLVTETVDSLVGAHDFLTTTVVAALESIILLLTRTIAPEPTADAATQLLQSADRISLIQAVLLQPASGDRDEAVRSLAMLFACDRRGGAGQPIGGTANQLIGGSRLDDSQTGLMPGLVSGNGLHSSLAASVGAVAQPPEVRFTATLASASIRVRALLYGVSLRQARSQVCVLFRRPDLVSQWTGKGGKTAPMHSWSQNFYPWWPPVSAWHRLDETPPTAVAAAADLLQEMEPQESLDPQQEEDEAGESGGRRGWVELRTHLELTAGKWSDAGTVELGLGYRLPLGKHSGEDVDLIILPLVRHKFLARVKLTPCAPSGHF